MNGDAYILAAALVGLGTAIASQVLWSAWLEWRARLVMWWRNRRAARGEVMAERLLRRHGYRILARQAEQTWEIRGDGRPCTIRLRADLLVTKGRRRYVAEVKTGAVAPHLRTASTRRQLLEYRMAYPVDGVILVDMEAGQLRHIDFPFERTSSPRQATTALAFFVLGALVGALSLAWWLQLGGGG